MRKNMMLKGSKTEKKVKNKEELKNRIKEETWK